MPVSTFSWMSAQSNASNAEFRKWVQGIHDALAACGLVQTADTGQIDIATVALPGTSTYGGYEIWRFDDALQATAPVFLKIEYGTGSSTTRPSIRITVSSATDGAGNPSGNIYLAALVPSGSMASSSTEYASYASGDGSSINVILYPTPMLAGSLGGFSISRSCDTSGAYNGDALAIVSHGANSPVYQVVGIDGSDPSVNCSKNTYLPVLLPYTVNNASQSASSTLSEDGTTAPTFPVPCAAPGVTPWVLNNLVVIHPGDAGATSVIQVASINGQDRTYRAFTGIGNTTVQGSAALVSSATGVSARFLPAIAWEV